MLVCAHSWHLTKHCCVTVMIDRILAVPAPAFLCLSQNRRRLLLSAIQLQIIWVLLSSNTHLQWERERKTNYYQLLFNLTIDCNHRQLLNFSPLPPTWSWLKRCNLCDQLPIKLNYLQHFHHRLVRIVSGRGTNTHWLYFLCKYTTDKCMSWLIFKCLCAPKEQKCP